METMNVTFDELSAMAFEQRSSKPGLQSMTYRQISSGLDLTYASSTITTQQPTEHELDLLFEAMYDDYIGGQPSAAPRTVLAAQAPIVLQTSTTSTTIADTDVDELETQQQHVLNTMLDGNTFVNPFATPSTSADESSSSQYVDPSNIHETNDDMCMYALTVSTLEPRNVKEAMTDPTWIESMQEELLQFKRIDVWVLVPTPDNIKSLTLKWLFKNKHDEENTVIRNKTRLVVRGYRQKYTQLFVDLMKNRFKMSMMREMTFFLRLQVNQSPRGIFINKSNYVLEILKKYRMETCDLVGTLMEIKDKLDLDQNGTLVDATKYRSMIGALMYLTSSRPDIVYTTCLRARYLAKPIEKHLK
ncbi:retrovirus-related pol polyprotein from transposon TNT 1-94 [Tanacetum coccineum]|uniref:Retrovirus-related pol polyprotein from transposon TNT 1-94 n=1 Tax=Tanacetum coccineum TaxID=301880 RepID=A0ABQ5D7B7_9ASTR